MPKSPPGELTFSTLPTADLTSAQQATLRALFEESYRDADADYLRAALGHLHTIALAWHDDALVGFSLGEIRHLDLPRLPGQLVSLGGLACVAATFRRRGVMQALQGRALMAGPVDGPVLACGRMAHPATYRQLSHLHGAVPKLAAPPSPWHQDVGRAVAAAYGILRFDPTTFVCAGRGRPIGHPVLDVEATAEEWALFERIDRTRGESLLGMGWIGAVPPGW